MHALINAIARTLRPPARPRRATYRPLRDAVLVRGLR